MEGYQTDIQALLRDINGNHQHDKSPQPPRPPTRPISCSFNSQAEHYLAPNNSLAPISEQQLLYDVQASRLLDTNTYSTLNNNDLDPYGSSSKLKIEKGPSDCCLDRALLNDPQHYSNRSMRTLPTERLSLPGHTAPYSPIDTFQLLKAQRQRRGPSGGVLPMLHR